MNETNLTGQPEKVILNGQEKRAQALVDILYLFGVTWLYVACLIYPLYGIIFGVIITASSISDKAKRIGKICLILGIINIVLSIIVLIILLVFSRFLNDLIGWGL